MVIAETAGTIPRPNLKGAKMTTIIPKSARLGTVIIILAILITYLAILGLEEI